ncbi:DeoR/GlpR family DNA-binding transcription regulator [Demequina zhanjiangensis]|uniref:Lactose phosphotransferase system repressor n=1 Tax=Demequina zhanjiangensis TaxID=3051659 RepID=A0ABT8G2Q9_9MICO|nr:DeoR/GlpR family DNA-binding transcription regulator [Demequina sp. SYSU T00b26]MDN4473421.1 DeoR/GlpR family DNA-binding transcription regulator [Demequina sp. SYSU T00b26]
MTQVTTGSTRNDELKRRLPAGRKARLAAAVAEAGQVTVAELAERFEVSVDTIRRDLDALDADGVLIRTHGGAVSPDALPKPESGLDIRKRVQTAAKETIGRLTAQIVEDGSSVLINGGTTTLAVARSLREHHDLTIATNNLLLSGELNPQSYRNLYVFGGMVRESSQATVCKVAFSGSGDREVEVHADLALIAVGGATLEGGFCTSNIAEAEVMRDMMDHADKVAILIDSTKFHRKLFAHFASLDEVDYVITETAPPEDFAAALSAAGVQVLHA